MRARVRICCGGDIRSSKGGIAVDEARQPSPGAALGKLGAQKGGKARAAKLTPSERSEAASLAAQARWGSQLVEATHTGVLRIGDMEIECAVLEGGTRVVNQGTVLSALGRAPTMGRRDLTDGRPPFLAAGNLVPFVPPKLIEMYEPVNYRLPDGRRAVGYQAEILPLICWVYIDARSAGKLQPRQMPSAEAADVLLRGLTGVAIIALVDEATGYQEERARRELQQILEAYVQPEFRKWVRKFPPEFFQEIYRLQGWEFRPGTSKRTPHVGKLIKHYIYEQLPPGVLAELERLNPVNSKGRRPRKHHQHLTETTGNEHLDRQISHVSMLMRISRNLPEFEEFFARAFPPPQERLPLVVEIADGPVIAPAGRPAIEATAAPADKATAAKRAGGRGTLTDPETGEQLTLTDD
jgi:hypothetical protein